VIDVATNTVTAAINVYAPFGVAVTPDGGRVYVANFASSGTVSAVSTATNTVVATIPVENQPFGVALSPDGGSVYVTNRLSNTVSVIATLTNTVTATITVGTQPWGLAVTPDGSKVYVANFENNTVSVIDTATNAVIATISVGRTPIAFGIFIQPQKPSPRFAGTPGKANCHGKSVSALAQQYGGLNNAAAALGYPSVSALQNAIEAYCEA
jgi:YVTN family beta-propeller protein